jgi:1,4-alpha-glucan branching enzyme
MHSFEALPWSKDSNIYEVNVRQYTMEGNFRAFEKEIPRLRKMGVEILWFMPITPISVEKRLGTLGSYYACSDYTAINPEFGTLEDFNGLVKTAHSLGCKVIIDWVANHTGWDHRWTKEHPEYYKRNAQGSFFDPHGWEDVIDLDYQLPALRTAMISAMKFWVEQADIDGFRCDMAMLVPLDFWQEARTQLDATKKLFWLAECEEIPYYQVFDATYSWKLLHAMEAYWRKEMNIDGFLAILGSYKKDFPADAIHCLFTTNHDENSHNGTEFERMGEAALAFAVLCCTWNGIPLIYSGQELPNRKKLKFFDKDQIDWTDKLEFEDFFTRLLLLRKRNKSMLSGDLQVQTKILNRDRGKGSLFFLRIFQEDEVLTLLNLSTEPVSFSADKGQLKGNYKELFSEAILPAEQMNEISVAPWGYKVFEKV